MARTSQMSHFRCDLAYITRTCTQRGSVGHARLIVQILTSAYGIRTSLYDSRMTGRTGVSKPVLFTGACTLPAHKPHGNRRLRVFATPLPKNEQRTRKTPVGMLPQHCMRVISYGLPTGLRTPSNSYGPGTTRTSHVI